MNKIHIANSWIAVDKAGVNSAKGDPATQTNWEMQMNQDEEAFVNAFIIRKKRSRYLQLLSNPKHRHEILDRLNHALDFAPTFATLLPPEQRSVEQVEKLLRQKAAEATCHIIADTGDIDGQDLPLQRYSYSSPNARLRLNSLLCSWLLGVLRPKTSVIGTSWSERHDSLAMQWSHLQLVSQHWHTDKLWYRALRCVRGQ